MRGEAGPRGSGDVYALAIDAESALLEYLDMYYRLGRAGKALDRFGVIEFATTIAPGRARRAADRQGLRGRQPQPAQQGRPPRTTRSSWTPRRPAGSRSSSTSTTSSPAWPRSGPIKSQADVVMTLLRSPRTAIHLVTVLEEMPVQETADGIAELRAIGLPIGGVIVNLVRPQDLDADERAPAARGDRRPRRDPRRPGEGRHRRRRRDGRGPARRRARTTPSGERSRTSQRAVRCASRSACRRTSCRGCRAASTWAGSTSWPSCSARRGCG